MRFAEAEQEYRELEEKLVRGELSEQAFLSQVAELRPVDGEGRRWMLSARTGRWLLHDGQQWVFAEPPREEMASPPDVEEPTVVPIEEPVDAAAPVVAEQALAERAPDLQPAAPRLMGAGVFALIVVACVIGAGISAWVLFFRDWGVVTPTPASIVVAPVDTYTPRPVTATYTPTFTPTPSRTPTPTITPIPSDTPIPTETDTPAPVTPTRTATSAPSPSPSATETVQPTSEPVAQTYTVKAGDTLFDIATRFGISVQELALANGMTDARVIRPGQVLEIPVPGTTSLPASAAPTAQTYTVKKGETLSEIASRFGVTVKAISDANGISNPALIRPGQVLIIPVPGTTPTTATATPTPTWTPIALHTATVRATATARVTTTPTRTPTPTRSGATSTPKPSNTPKPTATPTSKPAVLAGKIAFTVWNPIEHRYDLYVSLIDGTGRNKLGEGFRQPQFRQDGNYVAVNGDGSPNLEHLVTMNASGGEKLEVSVHSEDSFPTWRADGAIVAFSSDSWGDGRTRIGIVHDMFGKQWAFIPLGARQVEGDYPYWLADGRIVYHGCQFWGDGGSCGLYWVGAGGESTPMRLTEHESDTAPAGSGTRIAFMSARDGNWEVYTVNMTGAGLKRLTSNPAQDGLPTWSPDGESIAFVSSRGGAWAIWVMSADGSNQRKLFDLGGGYGSGSYDWTAERISWAP
jgi:LysM repeat protein